MTTSVQTPSSLPQVCLPSSQHVSVPPNEGASPSSPTPSFLSGSDVVNINHHHHLCFGRSNLGQIYKPKALSSFSFLDSPPEEHFFNAAQNILHSLHASHVFRRLVLGYIQLVQYYVVPPLRFQCFQVFEIFHSTRIQEDFSLCERSL